MRSSIPVIIALISSTVAIPNLQPRDPYCTPDFRYFCLQINGPCCGDANTLYSCIPDAQGNLMWETTNCAAPGCRVFDPWDISCCANAAGDNCLGGNVNVYGEGGFNEVAA